jgi:hypothetical protein
MRRWHGKKFGGACLHCAFPIPASAHDAWLARRLLNSLDSLPATSARGMFWTATRHECMDAQCIQAPPNFLPAREHAVRHRLEISNACTHVVMSGPTGQKCRGAKTRCRTTGVHTTVRHINFVPVRKAKADGERARRFHLLYPLRQCLLPLQPLHTATSRVYWEKTIARVAICSADSREITRSAAARTPDDPETHGQR